LIACFRYRAQFDHRDLERLNLRKREPLEVNILFTFNIQPAALIGKQHAANLRERIDGAID
jgi:hypothetical protein